MNEIEKAEIRERRLRPFGGARRNGGLGILHPTVMEHFPATLRGHGSTQRGFCAEPACIMNGRGKVAHSDRGRNIDEWLDTIGA